jgi:hypothetical protein
MLLVLLIRMRLLRMQSGDAIYQGGKLLGIRLVVSVFSSSGARRAIGSRRLSEKSQRVYPWGERGEGWSRNGMERLNWGTKDWTYE